MLSLYPTLGVFLLALQGQAAGDGAVCPSASEVVLPFSLADKGIDISTVTNIDWSFVRGSSSPVNVAVLAGSTLVVDSSYTGRIERTSSLTASLNLTLPTESDEGIYTCTVVHGATQPTRLTDFNLTVLDPPTPDNLVLSLKYDNQSNMLTCTGLTSFGDAKLAVSCDDSSTAEKETNTSLNFVVPFTKKSSAVRCSCFLKGEAAGCISVSTNGSVTIEAPPTTAPTTSGTSEGGDQGQVGSNDLAVKVAVPVVVIVCAAAIGIGAGVAMKKYKKGIFRFNLGQYVAVKFEDSGEPKEGVVHQKSLQQKEDTNGVEKLHALWPSGGNSSDSKNLKLRPVGIVGSSDDAKACFKELRLTPTTVTDPGGTYEGFFLKTFLLVKFLEAGNDDEKTIPRHWLEMDEKPSQERKYKLRPILARWPPTDQEKLVKGLAKPSKDWKLHPVIILGSSDTLDKTKKAGPGSGRNSVGTNQIV